MSPLTIETVPSPLGDLLLVRRGETIVALEFADLRARLERHLARAWPGLRPEPTARGSEAARRIVAFFGGRIDALDELRAEPRGTEFQRRVWAALRTIPPGRTLSYGELARRVGRPGAARAVGAANGGNPVALVVPCHRVVGSDGSLTGYAGGIERKRWLLRHERGYPLSSSATASTTRAISSSVL